VKRRTDYSSGSGGVAIRKGAEQGNLDSAKKLGAQSAHNEGFVGDIAGCTPMNMGCFQP